MSECGWSSFVAPNTERVSKDCVICIDTIITKIFLPETKIKGIWIEAMDGLNN